MFRRCSRGLIGNTIAFPPVAATRYDRAGRPGASFRPMGVPLLCTLPTYGRRCVAACEGPCVREDALCSAIHADSASNLRGRGGAERHAVPRPHKQRSTCGRSAFARPAPDGAARRVDLRAQWWCGDSHSWAYRLAGLARAEFHLFATFLVAAPFCIPFAGLWALAGVVLAIAAFLILFRR